jgi:hypothetical protein
LPAQEELPAEDSMYSGSLQPSLYVALSPQTCCASGEKGSRQDQGKHDALFVLPWN